MSASPISTASSTKSSAAGIVRDELRRIYVEAIARLAARGAEAVILGCTEIGMLIDDSVSPLPVYDTTDLHAKALVAARAHGLGGARRRRRRSRVKLSTMRSSSLAWASVFSSAALVSSTSAALCWVMVSSLRTADETSSMPEACSRLARAMASIRRAALAGGDQHVEELSGGLGDELGAGADFGAALLDQHLDLGRGLCRRLREAADFDGDDRKAAAGFAGAGGFDRGVEREEVGLEGDVVDEADDVGDLARRGGDPLHGVVGERA